MDKVRIPVTVEEGIFSDECKVAVRTSDGGTIHFFVDSEQVIFCGNNCFLEVAIAKARPNYIRILLPTETLEDGFRWIDVERNETGVGEEMKNKIYYEVVEIFPDEKNRTFYRTICVRERKEEAEAVLNVLYKSDSLGECSYDIIVRKY